MTDFPTAKELERFVYDETGIVLNLKGRANKLKYQVAMDVLNGVEVDQKFIGGMLLTNQRLISFSARLSQRIGLPKPF